MPQLKRLGVKTLLSGQSIRREISESHLTITPFSEVQLRAASYVLSLGSMFRRWRRETYPVVLWSLDASYRHLDEAFDSKDLILMPGEFVLACTAEAVGIPRDRFGVISTLSHVARFGLSVHGGADFVNPGFGLRKPTRLTLELCNHNPSPVTLTSGMPIAHLRIGMLDNEADLTGDHISIYEGADPLTAPRFFEEWHKAFNLEKAGLRVTPKK